MKDSIIDLPDVFCAFGYDEYGRGSNVVADLHGIGVLPQAVHESPGFIVDVDGNDVPVRQQCPVDIGDLRSRHLPHGICVGKPAHLTQVRHRILQLSLQRLSVPSVEIEDGHYADHRHGNDQYDYELGEDPSPEYVHRCFLCLKGPCMEVGQAGPFLSFSANRKKSQLPETFSFWRVDSERETPYFRSMSLYSSVSLKSLRFLENSAARCWSPSLLEKPA
ncbi:MAG: hypothetical protein A4E60_03112 [Syntrophorhabdus sp. PtaB.Bin047]|nr:MAG: hypothetical protein A4E60_03112 [Syntrophorhabdus sp. PtaB.Bin047]